VFLGFSEGGNFPAAIKAVALWFPKRERALATAIFNSGNQRRRHRRPGARPGHRVHPGLALGGSSSPASWVSSG